MKTRGITEDMVLQTISEPDELGKGYKDRKLAFKAFPPGRVKVVYVEENGNIFVITVMWD